MKKYVVIYSPDEDLPNILGVYTSIKQAKEAAENFIVNEVGIELSDIDEFQRMTAYNNGDSIGYYYFDENYISINIM